MREIVNFLGGKCTSCGDTNKLEVDHKDKTTKKFNITTGIEEVSAKKLWEEVKKCQLLCHECHKEKTIRETISPHGTKARYRNRHAPCRCGSCKDAYNKWHRESRRKRKELGLKAW